MQTYRNIAQQNRFEAMQPAPVPASGDHTSTSTAERHAVAAAIDQANHCRVTSDQIVLDATPTHGRRIDWVRGCRALVVRSADWDTLMWVQRDHDSATPWRWYGTETRKDADGRAWQRSLGGLVCDDFGTLVEVPQ